MSADVTLPRDVSPRAIAAAVERLSVAPAMRDPRPLPRLYEAGIVYRREPVIAGKVRERWQTPWETLHLGYGDCEDLSIWRVVELRRAGEVGAHVAIIPQRRGLYHAVVRRADGSIEDPTKRTMAMEIAPGKPSVNVLEHSPGRFVGTVTWRGKAYEVTVRALGDSTVNATQRATALAKAIAGNPIMAALMPPQAVMAIKVGSRLATIAKSGGKPALKAAVKALKGPGAKRLARALGFGL